jgi:long-chain acyl-CoA synthetase
VHESVVRGDVPPPDLGGGNLAFSLRAAAKRWPERVAITHEDAGLTFADVELRSARAATMLRERGIGRGDRVALQFPNVPAFVHLYFGALRLGAVIVPINPLLKAGETAYSLEDSGARILLAWHQAESPRDQTRDLAAVEVLSVHEPGGADLLDGFEPDRAVVEVDPEETAVILYTSGTTGRPKGAELTHRNLGLNTREVIRTFSISEADVFLGALPLFHSFGQTCTLNAAIAVGARLALLTRFEEHAAFELLDRQGVTVLMGVPTMFAALASVAEDRARLRTLRICVSGGAPLPREQMEDFQRATGAMVLESYGLSETSPAAALNRPGDGHRVGSVGRPIEGVGVRIVGEDGEELPVGAVGQIAIRGHNVMKGYWRREQATKAAITEDGWFLTGDLGRVDEDGFVYVIGRLKDMIIRGGFNVYPREVEEVLHQHPAVVEAAVVGFPDARFGEDIGAAVVLRPGSEVEPSELRDWVKERVAAYKYPRRIWTVDELPKGPTGKILKRAITVPEPKAST